MERNSVSKKGTNLVADVREGGRSGEEEDTRLPRNANGRKDLRNGAAIIT